MISLLGSLLGFGSSLIGPVLEAWNKNSDQKHELAMLHAQAEIQSKIQDQKLEATIVEADMAEIVAAHKEQATTVRKGPQWLAALSGSVRPVVTYLIIIEWLGINWAIAWIIMDEVENINFAIKKDDILKFLFRRRIPFEVSSKRGARETAEIVDRMCESVFPIFCLKKNWIQLKPLTSRSDNVLKPQFF